jgi:hypothetical protein
MAYDIKRILDAATEAGTTRDWKIWAINEYMKEAGL